MFKQPDRKDRAFSPVALKNRHWPDAVLTQAPIWLSSDLRDGKQALVEPMDIGVGIDGDIISASLKTIASGVLRARSHGAHSTQSPVAIA